MASRFPNSQHQRPPPPYPNTGGRGGATRGGGGQTFSTRGRGASASAGGFSSSSGSTGSQSAHPIVSNVTTSSSSSSASPANSSTPSTVTGSTSAPPLVQTSTTTQSTTTAPSGPQLTQVNESKMLSNPNPVCLCKIGQGTIQDIVSMTQELFTYLKMITPANTTTLATPAHYPGVLPIAVAQEKAAKAEELLKEINLLFKKLKVIYKNLQPIPNVNDDQGGLLLDIDMTEDLIPMKRKKVGSDGEPDVDEIMRKKKFESQAYMQAARELAEVKEKLRGINESLKSIIDDTRTTIWEINSMLGMRKLGS